MSDKHNSNQPPSLLGTPGDLIANLPGILGFYPSESVVFTVLFRQGCHTRYSLGPVIRININELHLLDDVGRALDAVEPDLIFAYVISEKVNSGQAETIIDQLYNVSEANVIDITACWATSGVFSGEPYQLAFGPPPEELSQTCEGLSDWEYGRIAPVTQAVATQNMLKAGHLPEITRLDAYALFDRGNRYLIDAGVRDLELQAKKLGDEILSAIHSVHNGSAYDAALVHFSDLVERAQTFEGTNGSDHLMQQPGLLRDTAAYLTSPLLRDSILHHSAESPNTAGDLFLAVARTFDGNIRSNALCLYAISAIKLELGMKAVPALDAALESNRDHNLSNLLCQGLMEGRLDALVDACLRGNQMVRQQYSTRAENAKGSNSDESEPAEAA